MIDNKTLEEIRYFPINFRIRKLRRILGLSQTEFAERIHTSQTSVSLWEKGRIEPTDRSLDKIVDVFDLPSDFFLDIDIQRLE